MADHTQFRGQLAQIMEGRMSPPNFAVDDPNAALLSIAFGDAPDEGRLLLPRGMGQTPSTWTARYWLQYTQRGAPMGTGLVVYAAYAKGITTGRAGRFAICEHEIVPTEGAEPHRGKHWSKCSKCGLNTSVDSGD